VAAINGITGVIDPDGRVVASTPARTQSYVDSAVGLYDVVTPAVRIGSWSARASVALLVLGWLLALGRYRRTRRPAVVAAAAPETSDAPTEGPIDRTLA
jgi:apolipoprotein N-acyltransferase